MEPNQALAIVRSLAEGIDPESGESFPRESAYQQPATVRALYVAAAALEQVGRAERRRAEQPRNMGAAWTEDEDRRLLAAFDAGRSLAELAASHQRTQGAIRLRLVKYGRLAA
jgi:hypothetical protein